MRRSGLALVASVAATFSVCMAAARDVPGPPRDLASAPADPDLATLRGELVALARNAAPGQLIPITIVLRDQLPADRRDALSATAGKSARRSAVTSALRDRAGRAQRDLMVVLRDEQARGAVGPRLRSLWIANVIATSATPEVIRAVAVRPEVAYVNHDRPVGQEILASRSAAAGTGPIECGTALMGAPQVWNDCQVTGDGVVISVIDSGACVTHPDLANQIWNNPGEIAGNATDDDSNGYVDDIVGWNFRDETNDPVDDVDHGTHVAGTAAGDGTGGTQTGVAPDAEVMILKIIGDFSAESMAWEAMQYSVENGADLMTASWGWPQFANPDRSSWRTVCDNTIAAGLVLIFIAGNEGDFETPPNAVRTPGDVPSVITVGATDCNDVIADFSSLGPVTWSTVAPFFDYPYPPGLVKPSVTAPGVDTVSTAVDCTSYSVKSGTSMAAPHVAGTVALMLEANPGLDHAGVKDLLMETAVDLGSPGMDNVYGAGRVDALAAVVAAARSNPDLDDDGHVGFSDLLMLLGNWGPCPPGTTHCPGDLDRDGVVGFADILVMIGAWGVV